MLDTSQRCDRPVVNIINQFDMSKQQHSWNGSIIEEFPFQWTDDPNKKCPIFSRYTASRGKYVRKVPGHVCELCMHLDNLVEDTVETRRILRIMTDMNNEETKNDNPFKNDDQSEQ